MRPRQSSLGNAGMERVVEARLLGFNEAEAIKPRKPRALDMLELYVGELQ